MCMRLPNGDYLAFLHVMPSSSGEATLMRVLGGGLEYDSMTGPAKKKDGTNWLDNQRAQLDKELKASDARKHTEGGAAAETEMLVFYSFLDQLISATHEHGGDAGAAIFVVVHPPEDRPGVRFEKRLLGGWPTYALVSLKSSVEALLRCVQVGAIPTRADKQRPLRESKDMEKRAERRFAVKKAEAKAREAGIKRPASDSAPVEGAPPAKTPRVLP